MKEALIAALTIAGGLVLGIAPTVLAPTASADTAADVGFTGALAMEGISYSSAAWIIGIGKAMCVDLRNGTPESTEVSSFLYINARTGHLLSVSDAWYLLGAAQSAYCPDTI